MAAPMMDLGYLTHPLTQFIVCLQFSRIPVEALDVL